MNEKVKVEVELPPEVVAEMDAAIELLGFRSREEFTLAAIRRLVDHYRDLMRERQG